MKQARMLNSKTFHLRDSNPTQGQLIVSTLPFCQGNAKKEQFYSLWLKIPAKGPKWWVWNFNEKVILTHNCDSVSPTVIRTHDQDADANLSSPSEKVIFQILICLVSIDHRSCKFQMRWWLKGLKCVLWFVSLEFKSQTTMFVRTYQWCILFTPLFVDKGCINTPCPTHLLSPKH